MVPTRTNRLHSNSIQRLCNPPSLMGDTLPEHRANNRAYCSAVNWNAAVSNRNGTAEAFGNEHQMLLVEYEFEPIQHLLIIMLMYVLSHLDNSRRCCCAEKSRDQWPGFCTNQTQLTCFARWWTTIVSPPGPNLGSSRPTTDRETFNAVVGYARKPTIVKQMVWLGACPMRGEPGVTGRTRYRAAQLSAGRAADLRQRYRGIRH